MNKQSNERFNELINYIEDNLCEDINYKKLSQILGVNEYTMHRIFLFITNYTLAEYIRKRRLSMAALDLVDNGDKIIEKVTVKEGKVVDVTKKIITNEAEIGSTNNEKGKPYNSEIMVMDKNQNDYKKEEEAEDKKYEKQQELKNETTNLARDF